MKRVPHSSPLFRLSRMFSARDTQSEARRASGARLGRAAPIVAQWCERGPESEAQRVAQWSREWPSGASETQRARPRERPSGPETSPVCERGPPDPRERPSGASGPAVPCIVMPPSPVRLQALHYSYDTPLLTGGCPLLTHITVRRHSIVDRPEALHHSHDTYAHVPRCERIRVTDTSIWVM